MMNPLKEIDVEIFGRQYRVSVSNGTEDLIRDLAKEFSAEVFRMSKQSGSITDHAFLYVLVGLLQLNEIKIGKEKYESLKKQNETLQKEADALRKQVRAGGQRPMSEEQLGALAAHHAGEHQALDQFSQFLQQLRSQVAPERNST